MNVLAKLDLQLKCHAQATPNEDQFSYTVKIKNYHDLRDDTVLVPRILVVVLVPDETTDWLTQTETELAMRRCGYWLSLRGMDPTTNTANVTLTINRAQQFTSAGLSQMMQRIGSGGMP